jgi:hypothetical protein
MRECVGMSGPRIDPSLLSRTVTVGAVIFSCDVYLLSPSPPIYIFAYSLRICTLHSAKLTRGARSPSFLSLRWPVRKWQDKPQIKVCHGGLILCLRAGNQ